MTIIEMLQVEIDTIKKKFWDKWIFTKNDAVQIIIGIRFSDKTTHFILPDKLSTIFLSKRLLNLLNDDDRWKDNGDHKDTFKHPLDNLQPFIVDEEFHIE